MVWAIILTIVICSLFFAAASEYSARCRAEDKCAEYRKKNQALEAKIAQLQDMEVKRLCRDNYRQGLSDGNKCDSLYKSIVAKYQAREQVTVMMYGEPKKEG